MAHGIYSLKSVKLKVDARAARDGARDGLNTSSGTIRVSTALGLIRIKMTPVVPQKNSPRRKPIRLTQATRRLLAREKLGWG